MLDQQEGSCTAVPDDPSRGKAFLKSQKVLPKAKMLSPIKGSSTRALLSSDTSSVTTDTVSEVSRLASVDSLPSPVCLSRFEFIRVVLHGMQFAQFSVGMTCIMILVLIVSKQNHEKFSDHWERRTYPRVTSAEAL